MPLFVGMLAVFDVDFRLAGFGDADGDGAQGLFFLVRTAITPDTVVGAIVAIGAEFQEAVQREWLSGLQQALDPVIARMAGYAFELIVRLEFRGQVVIGMGKRTLLYFLHIHQ